MALRITVSIKRSGICSLNGLNKGFASSTTPELPKNMLENVISAHAQRENGVVYDKRPFRIVLEAGKRYSWCLCGRSHKQPFCDGTHRTEQLKITHKPIKFMVDETKEYWLCNCKQTHSRPFCDGTHKNAMVQEATSIIRQ